MKRTLRQGGPDALDYYSTTAGDNLGWAYLPSIVTKPGQAYLDGVVADCGPKGDDFVDDIPAQRVPTNGCPLGQDTCSAPGYTEFTAGQTQRARDAWLFYRAGA